MSISLTIANDPRDRGVGPDGVPLEANSQPTTRSGASVKDAVRTVQFMGLYAACLICAFGVFVPFVHLIPYAIDHQVKPASAALLLGVIGVGSTVGRFLLGGLADRIGRASFLIAMFAGMAAALTIWAVASSFRTLTLFALLFGAFYGGWVAILPAVVMDYFGGRNVSGIIGILYTSVAIGTLIGPSAAGFAFDINHSYLLPIVASAVANIIAAIVVMFTTWANVPIAEQEMR